MSTVLSKANGARTRYADPAGQLEAENRYALLDTTETRKKQQSPISEAGGLTAIVEFPQRDTKYLADLSRRFARLNKSFVPAPRPHVTVQAFTHSLPDEVVDRATFIDASLNAAEKAAAETRPIPVEFRLRPGNRFGPGSEKWDGSFILQGTVRAGGSDSTGQDDPVYRLAQGIMAYVGWSYIDHSNVGQKLEPLRPECSIHATLGFFDCDPFGGGEWLNQLLREYQAALSANVCSV